MRAQSLSDELLEEVRLLANAETETQSCCQSLLAGQPGTDRLDEPHLRQLETAHHATSLCRAAFSLGTPLCYIAWRVRAAGGESQKVFSQSRPGHS